MLCLKQYYNTFYYLLYITIFAISVSGHTQRVDVVDNLGSIITTGLTVSSSTPSSPIMGDLWRDTGHTDFKEVLKVYDGTNWIIINNSENIYIKDNTVDIDGNGINDDEVTLQDYVTNINNLVNINLYPSNINSTRTLSQSDLEDFDLFYVENAATVIITLEDISIVGKVIRIVEFETRFPPIEVKYSGTKTLTVNDSNALEYETASFIWNGSVWLPFR